VKPYLDNVDNKWFRQRLNSALLVVLVVFLVLIGRLAYLQVLEGPELRRLSVNNCIRLRDIDAPRGLIFDRHGTLLVDNRPAFDLAVVLKDARPLDRTLERLSGYIGVPADVLNERIAAHQPRVAYRPIPVVRDINRETLAAVEVHKYDLPGVEVLVNPRRYSLYGSSAAHVIGYLGEISPRELQSAPYRHLKSGDFIGKVGIEKKYEASLEGDRGGRQVEVDATGATVRTITTVDADPGQNLFLSLDHPLQQTAEELLAGQVGAAVALDPNTGQVLAMASSPAFDPNAFVDGMSKAEWEALASHPEHPLDNKALRGEYPPASTFKIITALAALEDKVIDPDTVLDCPGQYHYGDRVFRCWRRAGHGSLNVVQALEQSCDVFFYQVGQRVGIDRLAYYASACGLGRPTGIDLENEAQGLVPTRDWKLRRFGQAWQSGETLSIAIGQGYNLVTPLQMAVVIAAVANGGTLYRPLLVDRIETARGALVGNELPQVLGRIPVSEATLNIVRQGLFDVVQSPKGTAHRIRTAAVAISGKTGTAQVIGRKEDDPENPGEDETVALHHRAHAWFVAYAPSEHPVIAISVIIEHGEHGSSAAAPIARSLIDTYLGTSDTTRQP